MCTFRVHFFLVFVQIVEAISVFTACHEGVGAITGIFPDNSGVIVFAHVDKRKT